jgi:hypothetical protein
MTRPNRNNGCPRVLGAAALRRSIFALSGLFVALPNTVPAQTVLPLQACGACSIRFERLVVLPSRDLPEGLASAPTSISVDGEGRYYITQYQEGTSILVFHSDGRFARRIGAKGDGPGEFRRIATAAIRGDSLFVLDMGLRRLSVLTLDGNYIRGVPVQLFEATSMVFRDTHTLIVAGGYPTVNRVGLPLHEIDLSTGEIRNSFGATNPVVRPFAPWLTSRAIAMDGEGRIWGGKNNAYELELWDANHQRVHHFRRDLAWFAPWIERPVGTADPPPPWLMALAIIDGRYVLTAIVRPAPNYTERLGPQIRRGDKAMYDRTRYRLLKDTVLEVVDVDTRRVVARGLMDDYIVGFIPGTTIAYAYDVVEGTPQVTLLRIHFERSTQ